MGTSPVPVLVVLPPDVLDSQDALQLWSVFSKCKNSLQNGQRLEYISWRLAFRDLAQKRRLLHGPWPPTPESICSESDDSSNTKSSSSDSSNSSSSAATSPFFRIVPRKPMAMPVRPAGRIICDMVNPGLTQKLPQFQKDAKKDQAYPTPNSSDSSDSASSSAVSIAVESPTVQQHLPEVPKLVVLTPTPNLTPHPTPPATPLLGASAPPAAPRTLGPLIPPTPSPPESTRREPPGPILLPLSATRGMGSPAFTPHDPAVPQSAYAPQSTHLLPLGGRDLVSVPGSSAVAAKTNTGSKFLLGRARRREREFSQLLTVKRNDGSDSSRERDQVQTTFVHGSERGLGNARGRGRGQARIGGRRSSSSDEQIAPQQQHKPPSEAKKPEQPPPAPQSSHPKQQQQQSKMPRSISAPYLGGLGLGLEMTPNTESQANGRQPAAPAPADAEDARSVSSLATSASNARTRARGKQPARSALRSQHSRSRSRKGGTRTKDGRQFGVFGITSNLPSNIDAGVQLVEQTMTRRTKVQMMSDEEDEWSDEDDESAVGAESGDGEEVEQETEQDDEEGWEDEESESVENAVTTNSKAPPPSLQQQPAPHLGHSRNHSTGAPTASTDLRQLPTRPHRSVGHLPALANAGAAPVKHHPTTSDQNARTDRALKATMSATTISSAMLEAQRGPRLQQQSVAEQYRQQQQQLQQQNGVGAVPALRPRPGGFGGLGLHMSSARPPSSTGGAELSPIPPTPATAVQQQQQQPAARRDLPPPAAPPSPRQQKPQQQHPDPPPPPRRPGMQLARWGRAGSPSQWLVLVGLCWSQPPTLEARRHKTGGTSAGVGRSGGYRPKGPPAEMEYDDDDEESDADGRGKSKVSESVAHERLRNFLSRAKTGSTTNADAAEAERRRLFEEAGDVPWVTATAPNQHNVPPDHAAQPPPLNRSMTTVPVEFPYNLPPACTPVDAAHDSQADAPQ
ncbi:DUF1752-domain-containing protein [Mycena sanguinolenta]|uniref:DUF1752-domain-containing protein n=1 Tax=Mycena sanguinolenta TaxID=230812 RepID=A0A8H7CYB3_9AGAR|nr:DUF1752-domain-containing protein [Mycena sanguinolenta]